LGYRKVPTSPFHFITNFMFLIDKDSGSTPERVGPLVQMNIITFIDEAVHK
jgi:hypothetical protein